MNIQQKDDQEVEKIFFALLSGIQGIESMSLVNLFHASIRLLEHTMGLVMQAAPGMLEFEFNRFHILRHVLRLVERFKGTARQTVH